jgi:restriction system protein
MARRGFFAELQRQVRIAQREQERRQREATREHAALVRRREQAQKEEARTLAQLAKANAAERRRLEKEAREAHLAAKDAEVDERNQELSEKHSDIDTLLASTLARDDFVDLETLRTVAQHPPFGRTDLERPSPLPQPVTHPREPKLRLPDAPRGLGALCGKKKHARSIEEAKQEHQRAFAEWQANCRNLEAQLSAAKEEHTRAEQKRLAQLDRERARYAEERRAREEDAAGRNRNLDELITNLGYGTASAVQEYVSIVLSNSVYPDHFPVSHEFDFTPETAELNLRVAIPEPGQLITEKAFKYTKATDEILPSFLSQKECRDRYAGAVHQIALRSIHEVFEADRRGLIRTISLEVGTSAVDPATGRRGYVPFLITAAERDAFLEFDLAAVVPIKTLERMGAAISKNPYSLTPADRSGIRRA